MKTTARFNLLLIGLGTLFGACEDNMVILPSGNVTVHEKKVEDFNGIIVSSTFVVDVSYSDTESSVFIEANENLHHYVVVETINDKLVVRLENGVGITNYSILKVHITTNRLIDYYSISEASSLTMNNTTTTDHVDINLSGAGHFVGEFNVISMDVTINGASNATLRGSTDYLNAHLSKASLLRDYGMSVKKANLQLSGASHASLTITESIDFIGTNASLLRYKGEAIANYVKLSGASQIIKIE